MTATAATPEKEKGGVEPAVSPNGRRLAFARSVAPGDPVASHDVWVLELP